VRQAALVALSLLGLASCGFVDELAEDLGSPFGVPDVDVLGLPEADVEVIIGLAVARFSSYVALREAIPFELLTNDSGCGVARTEGAAVVLETDLGCALGGAGSGAVSLRQEARSTATSSLPRFTLTYTAAVAHGLRVDGVEVIDQTADGASDHDLALVQDEVSWRYRFRASELAPETPAFDYLIPSRVGEVPVRLTNAETIGGFATVILFGRDGVVRCDLRNSDPDLGVRGRCDNGLVFGLP
jgi:hypothetical protein